MANNIKTLLYITPAEALTIQNGGSAVIAGVTISLANIEDYDVRVKYEEPNIPVKEIDINGTKVNPDADGKVNLTSAAMQGVVDAGVKGSTNYKQITYYEVDSNTAHHAKLYIEEID